MPQAPNEPAPEARVDIPRVRPQGVMSMPSMHNAATAAQERTMSPTPWRIKADYLENCNCDLLCPCLFAVAPTEGDCNVPIAYHIREGHYGTVQLDDLTVVRLTIFPGPGLMS